MQTNTYLRDKYAEVREHLLLWYAFNNVVPMRGEATVAAWIFLSDIAYSCARKHYGKPQSYRSSLVPREQGYADFPRTQSGEKYYEFHTERMMEFVTVLRKNTRLNEMVSILVMATSLGTVKNFRVWFAIVKILSKRCRSVWWVLYHYRKTFASREVMRHYKNKGIAVSQSAAFIITRLEALKNRYGENYFTPEEEGSLVGSMRQGVLYPVAKNLLHQVSLDILDFEGGEDSVDGSKEPTNIFDQ